MSRIDEYLKEISAHGDKYGYKGGLHDLLTWCGKMSLREVTEEDAKGFLEYTKNKDNEKNK